jgi:hypothetical protein
MSKPYGYASLSAPERFLIDNPRWRKKLTIRDVIGIVDALYIMGAQRSSKEFLNKVKPSKLNSFWVLVSEAEVAEWIWVEAHGTSDSESEDDLDYSSVDAEKVVEFLEEEIWHLGQFRPELDGYQITKIAYDLGPTDDWGHPGFWMAEVELRGISDEQ